MNSCLYDSQKLFYEQINKIVMNNKISHAYLIETNNCDNKYEIIMDFIVKLFSINYKGNTDISKLIKTGSFSDYYEIDIDGDSIKKEQILDIKKQFKTTSIDKNYRIYLIKGADRMNQAAANSLLKFLEEPDGQVIAILETDNRYKMMDTIISRCQVLSLINNNDIIDKDTDLEMLNKMIFTLETFKNKSIAHLPIMMENDYKDKKFWISVFKSLIIVYENSLRKIYNLNFSNFEPSIEIITSNNSSSSIIHKISILFEYLKRLDYNVNINMMVDDFIIDFNGVD